MIFVSKAESIYVPALLLCYWSKFACVEPSLDAGNSAQMYKGGFQIIFQDPVGFRNNF